METTSVTAETIDLSDVNEDTSILINPILEEGVQVANGSPDLYLKVRVTEKKHVDKDQEKDEDKEKDQEKDQETDQDTDTDKKDQEQEQTGSQKFSIPGSSVTLQNVPDGLTAKVNTGSVSVKVTGDSSKIQSITDQNISLAADLSGLEAGTHKVALSVSCDGEYTDIAATPAQIEVVLE